MITITNVTLAPVDAELPRYRARGARALVAAAVVVAAGLTVAGSGTAYAAEDDTASAVAGPAAGGGTANITAGGGTAYITVGGGLGYAIAAAGTSRASTANGGAAGAPGTCEYWTTDEGVSAVVVTSGINCGAKSFTISVAPYLGAVFSDLDGETAYNSFLSQIDEFINGPASAPAPFGGTAPSVSGLTMIGSADSAVTNHVPVYLYEGPGDRNDGAAEALDAVLHNTFTPQG